MPDDFPHREVHWRRLPSGWERPCFRVFQVLYSVLISDCGVSYTKAQTLSAITDFDACSKTMTACFFNTGLSQSSFLE